MQLIKSFPPADDLFVQLQQVDYQKLYHDFMDVVVVFCAFVAAVATVIRDKWQQYDCTERLQLFAIRVIAGAKTFYAWTMTVFVPECKEFYADCRAAYNFLRTV